MQRSPLLWGDKRYHTWNYHLRQMFGEKVFKVPLDAGFTCPNRDGTVGLGGCIFCSSRGSGDFAGTRNMNLFQQFSEVTQKIHLKWPKAKYMGYFQAYTNTYAKASDVRQMYESVLGFENVVGLSIATRPDCLPPEILDVLEEINRKTYLWLELGLQTMHDRTLKLINRGHDYQAFLHAVKELRQRDIRICTHIILGLPGENERDMLDTAEAIASLPVQGLKIHLLHLLRGTPMVELYEHGDLNFLEQPEYVELVVKILERMPPEVVIHRLTGDGPPEDLIGPLWSRKKWEVLNAIDAELLKKNTWQGRLYERQ